MDVSRSLRGARAAVFAAACVSVSAAGHVWMSGAAIPAWALLGAAIATVLGGYALAGRQRGFAPIAALMLVGELGLHLLFTWAQHAVGTGVPGVSGMTGTPGMSMSAMPGMTTDPTMPDAAVWLCDPTTAVSSPSSMGWMSAHDSAGMVAVHAAAGLLSAWWLRRGEAAVFRLMTVVACFAMPLLIIVWPASPAIADLTLGVPADHDGCCPALTRLLVHAVVRRGPPAPVFSM